MTIPSYGLQIYNIYRALHRKVYISNSAEFVGVLRGSRGKFSVAHRHGASRHKPSIICRNPYYDV